MIRNEESREARRGIVLLSLLATCLFAGVVKAQSLTASAPGSNSNPLEEYHSKSEVELKRLLNAYKAEASQIRQEEAKTEERRLVKSLARDLVDHSYREPNLKLREVQLQMAQALNEDPEGQIAKLRIETKTKREAELILKRVLNETNPDTQDNLLFEAEKKIYWLETGKTLERKVKKPKMFNMKSPPKNTNTIAKETVERQQTSKGIQFHSSTVNAKGKKSTKSLNGNKVPGWRKDKVVIEEKVQEAKDIAIKLVREAQNETETVRKNQLMTMAYDLLHKPEEALLRYYDWQHQQWVIREEAKVLMEKVFRIENETLRLELIKRLDEFYKHPIEEVKKIRDNDTRTDYKQAKQLAIELLEQAKVDTNPASQEVKIQAAKKLMARPLTTIKKMRISKAEDKFKEKVPPMCHQVINVAFEHKLSNLEDWDFNMIEAIVEERKLIFSQGGDWKQEVNIEGKALGSSDVCLAKKTSVSTPEVEARDQLIRSEHMDSMLADTFASFLKSTYTKLAATPIPNPN